jgi:hypothetical protein
MKQNLGWLVDKSHFLVAPRGTIEEQTMDVNSLTGRIFHGVHL